MGKKVLLLLLIFVNIFSKEGITSAKTSKKQSIEQDIKNKQVVKSQLKEKIESEKKEISGEILKKNQIETEISNLSVEIDLLRTSLCKTCSALKEKEKQLVEIEETKSAEKKKFKERIRTMYEEGAVDYVTILLESKDIADFVRRTDAIYEISLANEQLLEKIKETERKLNETKREIEKVKSDQEYTTRMSKEKSEQLLHKREERIVCIRKIECEMNENKRKYDEAEKCENALKKQLAKILTKAKIKNSVSARGFLWPTASRRITSRFGYRIHPILKIRKFHTGIDIAANMGTPVYASKDGRVAFAGWNGGYGNCIVIDHEDGTSTLYAHLRTIDVSVNQKVSKGKTIGAVGSSGSSSGPHLHFEILVNGSATNPLEYL